MCVCVCVCVCCPCVVDDYWGALNRMVVARSDQHAVQQ